MNTLIRALTACAVVGSIAACQESSRDTAVAPPAGPAERAGRRVDQAVGKSAEVAIKAADGARVVGRQATTQVSDAVITTKAKTALFRDAHTSGFQINVNTFRGVVQLSGFVDTPDQKRRAGELAERIEGVRTVHNDLIVTTGSAFMAPAVSELSAPPNL
jgi:osmotically-inducible protein OsmY